MHKKKRQQFFLICCTNLFCEQSYFLCLSKPQHLLCIEKFILPKTTETTISAQALTNHTSV